MFTAQEIIVGNADYPTEKIAENSRKFRQLGLGYANLGALLMAQGMAYDSEAGRAWAATITALMTGHAYSHERAHGRPHGPVRGLLRQRRADAQRVADAPGGSGQDRRRARPARPARRRAEVVGRRGGAGRALRRAQLAGERARAHRHDRPHDGLRHHRHRARPRAHQGEEARGWRHDVHRQPDHPACTAQARVLRRPGRRDRRVHRRAQDDDGRARASTRSTCRCSRARWATTRSTTWATSR